MFSGSVVLHGAVAVGEYHGLEQEELLLAETDVVESVQQYHALNTGGQLTPYQEFQDH